MRLQPQGAGCGKRIYCRLAPPRPFIAGPMDLTMMRAAERDGELVADFTTECTRLREAQMVWIGRPTAANQARLFHDMPDVVAVAKATSLRKGERTFFDLRSSFGQS
jgi:hypothetical protein